VLARGRLDSGKAAAKQARFGAAAALSP
jgi:hypothetical protein